MKYERYDVPPTREAEDAEIAKAQAGDEEAWLRLHRRYQLYLLKQARRYCGRFMDSPLGEDLLSVANVAFHGALTEYRPDRGARFVTLLWLRCRRYLLEEVNAHMEGRPLEAANVDLSVLDTPGALSSLYDGEYGGIPSSEEDIVNSHGIHPDADVAAPEVPGDALVKAEFIEEFRRLVDELPAWERDIIKKRYWDRVTMADLAEITKISRSSLREIALTVLRRLREDLTA